MLLLLLLSPLLEGDIEQSKLRNSPSQIGIIRQIISGRVSDVYIIFSCRAINLQREKVSHLSSIVISEAANITNITRWEMALHNNT